MGSLLIVCCLVSAHAEVVAVAAAAAAAAAGVIDAWSLIVVIEQDDSKPSFDACGRCGGAAQADGLRRACHGSYREGRGGGGETHLCLPPKLTKR